MIVSKVKKDKNFTEFYITASAESIIDDDELLKIEDFIK